MRPLSRTDRYCSLLVLGGVPTLHLKYIRFILEAHQINVLSIDDVPQLSTYWEVSMPNKNFRFLWLKNSAIKSIS